MWFSSALAGGVAVFGEYNAINSQINMYILSRIIMGSVRAAINNGYLTEYQYGPCCA